MFLESYKNELFKTFWRFLIYCLYSIKINVKQPNCLNILQMQICKTKIIWAMWNQSFKIAVDLPSLEDTQNIWNGKLK